MTLTKLRSQEIRAAMLQMAATSATENKNLTVSLVIPTKNEAKNLPYVLPRIPSIVTELILVDADSTDGTVEVARRLYPKVRVVGQTGRGKGNALRAGFDAAEGDIIVMLDADGSMAPEEIPAYIGALIAGADYAKGSRFMHGGGTVDMEPHRYLGNLGLTLMVRALFGGMYTDLCYGYCAFRRSVLPDLNLTSDGFEIETEMNVRALMAGIRVVEVPSFESERIYGTSNLNAIKDGFRVLNVILQEKFINNTSSKKERIGWTKDEFTPAMRLLIEEATNLDHQRPQLPELVYINAVNSIKAASLDLLNQESAHPGVRRQQEIYRQSGDKMWRFLDSETGNNPEIH
ncbi:MAG: glycosyltransferase family 2 protein [Pleurocapsa minor GSE-CHR-MK-17-07R]|jgi:glycosyltransferase involved in cell wall biosynthesis|nr:glycosyltransferase family 2 protein [Pleurocapsa minor GSE-CHR-MK 17-07R]